MADTPRVLTIRLKPTEDGTSVLFEAGRVELEKKIPASQGVVRMSLIFNGSELTDAEVVTTKLES
jgi:hypothetical protein